VLVEGELACPTCAGSPLCDRCGHRRADHSGVFRPGGRRCGRVRVDFQTGVRVPCGCEGFTPVGGPLREANFLDRDPDDGLPPLRIAR
jgi:hypothetical protein